MIFRKIRTRWSDTRVPCHDDFFAKPPWWLRAKRFSGKQRTEKELWADAIEDWKDDEWDGGGK
jgi:hypothetical protein